LFRFRASCDVTFVDHEVPLKQEKVIEILNAFLGARMNLIEASELGNGFFRSKKSELVHM